VCFPYENIVKRGDDFETNPLGRKVISADKPSGAAAVHSDNVVIHAQPRKIHYTKGVQAHWREMTVGEHGEIVLENLPFDAGQPVEVLVISKSTGSKTTGNLGLRDSVLEYREPLEPVVDEAWDALQ
jgi:hypothetical protein